MNRIFPQKGQVEHEKTGSESGNIKVQHDSLSDFSNANCVKLEVVKQSTNTMETEKIKLPIYYRWEQAESDLPLQLFWKEGAKGNRFWWI